MNYRTYMLGYIQGMIAERTQGPLLTEEFMRSKTNVILMRLNYKPMTDKEHEAIKAAKLKELERD